MSMQRCAPFCRCVVCLHLHYNIALLRQLPKYLRRHSVIHCSTLGGAAGSTGDRYMHGQITVMHHLNSAPYGIFTSVCRTHFTNWKLQYYINKFAVMGRKLSCTCAFSCSASSEWLYRVKNGSQRHSQQDLCEIMSLLHNGCSTAVGTMLYFTKK